MIFKNKGLHNIPLGLIILICRMIFGLECKVVSLDIIIFHSILLISLKDGYPWIDRKSVYDIVIIKYEIIELFQ